MKHKSFFTLFITPRKRHGFTVIELVVVIVVIGILAAISITVYGGVTKRAVETSMQSDLDTGSAVLELDNRQNGAYPSNAASANGGKGLATSTGNILTYTLKPYGYCIATVNAATSNTYAYKSSTRTTQNGNCDSIVSTLAGSGVAGFMNGTGINAQFNYPGSIAVDASGNVYTVDNTNPRVRKITSSGVVTTLAGNGTTGFADGSAINAMFYNPNGIAVDTSGNVYVADTYNQRIRKITSSGVVSTLAGSGPTGALCGYTDGAGTIARFCGPYGIEVDNSGNVYVSDTGNNVIRKITSAGVVSTLAGTSASGYVDGAGTVAQFNGLGGVTVDSAGTVYAADQTNNRIRQITSSGFVSTLAGPGNGYLNGPTTVAKFAGPEDVAIDVSGNIYVADQMNNVIRKIDTSSVVSTLAGTGVAGFADGSASIAQFNSISGVAVDASGNVYVAEFGNQRIRKITQ